MKAQSILQPTLRPKRCHRQGLVVVAVLGVLLMAGSLPAAARSPRDGDAETGTAARIDFERYELELGPDPRQTIVTGFFLGGAMAEVAVVRPTDDGERRLAMFAFDDGSWAQRIDASLGRAVQFIDVANIDGRDRLVSYEPGHLLWFDPEAAVQRRLVSVDVEYQGAAEGWIPRVDIARDLNGDDRDDLVLPDFDGFWVSTQASDGSFAECMKLGPPEPYLNEVAYGDERTYQEAGLRPLTIPWYLSRVRQMDYNHDGRVDLVFWNVDHFDVHLQSEQGSFEPVAKAFTVDVPFDSDGTYSLIFGLGDAKPMALILGWKAKTKKTVLSSVTDIDGDGVGDLVTQTLEGRSILRMRSLYRVYAGSPTSDGTTFSPTATVQRRGKASGVAAWGYASQSLKDIDGDGAQDIMFSDVRTGLGGMMRALVGNSVALDLEFFRSEGGTFPREPTTTRKVRRFAPFAGIGNVFFPTVLVGDVNGDARSDLMIGKSPKELHVYAGVPSPGLFAREPQKVAVELPGNERDAWLADLNKDGKQDLVVYRRPKGDAPGGPRRVEMLIAR